MDEAQNESVEEVIATPEAEAVQDEKPAVEEAKDDSQDRNWRELRRAKEDWERRAKQQEEMNQQLMNRLLQPAAPQTMQQAEEDILAELQREEYVSGEKVAKSFKRLEDKFERKLEEVKKSYAEQKKQEKIQGIKMQYPDFDSVVNPDSIAALEQTKPALAQMIAESGDPYKMAVQSYEYIKALGLDAQGSSSKRMKEVEKRIEQNKKTVQSPQAFDKRPMAAAFKMTKEQMDEVREEMQRAASQVGYSY